MGIVNKLFGNRAKLVDGLAQKAAPSLRFGGFRTMGAHTKPVDTRTTEQLLANIDYFAERCPEVAKFKKELKAMNPKHLGLVSDICELGDSMAFLPTNISLKELKAENGKSLFALLIEKLPKASKENPKALEFAQEVINQTDDTASKYFLARAHGTFDCKDAAEHLAATKPFVKEIAESTLSGGYTMDFSKERKFVDVIGAFVHPSINPENIRTLQKVGELADAQNKTIDTIGFIRNNVNLY